MNARDGAAQNTRDVNQRQPQSVTLLRSAAFFGPQVGVDHSALTHLSDRHLAIIMRYAIIGAIANDLFGLAKDRAEAWRPASPFYAALRTAWAVRHLHHACGEIDVPTELRQVLSV